ncbi:MAG: type I DNA topoisomerase [Candidatus Omnitrophica bacterium]|nr:type I DNA topoisomerase [Candidatus Omnitrophota bacterium]MCG2704634.1 type I DNA topoisomerase [Candidatus Omnitrophota bacterium]
MAKHLVVVESPTKSKTINKFLGSDYIILSSMGHVIDLPKSEMGVDLENDFKPRYIVMAKRRKILSELKKGAKETEDIYLAMDPDREGEAIAYHLRDQLSGINDKIHRVTFHEITERAIKEAFKNPHILDINKVNAQQARRILDRVLGYSLSPLLWKKVGSGLSAGRVQSVALRLVAEREQKIKAFIPVEYWEVEALLKKRGALTDAAETDKGETRPFKAKLILIDGNESKLKAGKEAEAIIGGLKEENFIVKSVREIKKRRSPYPPYTTSKMQQDAFNKLGFSVGKTMKVAQELYEGIELGKEEAAGLITYMRTDSVNVSKEAENEVREYITKKFGKKYCPAAPNKYKSKKSAEEAHEAIRPSLPLHEPDAIKEHLSSAQHKLYELIWTRFVTSQMEPALNLVVSADIEAGKCIFRASGTKVLFDGFTALYHDTDKETNTLPHLQEKELLVLIKLDPSQHFTNPPPRFSDASLVKELEEKGIGRPSTYAPIISTITLRNYVKREKGYLYPTELGMVVTELLTKHFPKVLDIKFTAYLEEELDEVEEGKIEWLKVLRDFYSPFKIAFEKAQKDMKSIKNINTPTNEVCDKCGKPMVIKWGRKGKFLSCSDFPRCKNAKSITTGVKCPQPDCRGELVERRSSRGAFYGCTKFPACRYVSRTLPSKDTPDNKLSTGVEDV